MNFEFLYSFIRALISAPSRTKQALKLKMLATLALFNKLKTQVLLRAYAIYTSRGIVQANGFAARRGFTTSEGIGILMAGIFAVIFLYFVAFAVPGALTAIATTALVSVNAGIQTIFQVLFALVAVFTFILILVSVLRKVAE
jgi:hypothetical protein